MNAYDRRAWTSYRQMAETVERLVARDLYRLTSLSEADYGVLLALRRNPDMIWRLRDLSDYLAWSKSRVAHQLSRMERRGYVVRGDSTGVGAAIWLSPSGTAAVDKATPAYQDSVNRHVFDVLTAGQIAALTDISAALLQAEANKDDGAIADA